MPQTSWYNATHAVIGIDDSYGYGVLFLFDNEFEAHKHRKEVEDRGGRAEVEPVEDGELSEEGKEQRDAMMAAFFGP